MPTKTIVRAEWGQPQVGIIFLIEIKLLVFTCGIVRG